MKTQLYLISSLLLFLIAIACDTGETGIDEQPADPKIELVSISECKTQFKLIENDTNLPAIRLIALDNNILLIKAINTELNCATDSVLIQDSLQGKDIVTEAIDLGPYDAKCYCPVDLEFTIGPLQNTNYTLLFIESESSYDRDTFFIDFRYSPYLDTLVTKSGKSKNLSSYPLVYLKTDLGGCNIEEISTNKTDEEKNDTIVFYDLSDSLKIYVGLNLTCCIEFGSTSEINGDTLIMQINTLNDEFCNCICYYEFDYYFSNYIKQGFYYQFYIDDYIKFEGKYNMN